MAYNSGEYMKVRYITPYVLLRYKENYYLSGYCKLRDEIRMFRLDRIEYIEVTNKKFTPHGGTALPKWAQRSEFLVMA